MPIESGPGPELKVVTANVNGIRAAARRGGLSWLADSQADLICLQEVRATGEQFAKVLADNDLGHLQVAYTEALAAGRAGVAVLSPHPIRDVVASVGPGEFVGSGRWIEATVDTATGPVTAVSVYVHAGQADTPKQSDKYRFLAALRARMLALSGNAADGGGDVVVCGDINVAHTEADIKNWRGNLGKSGFLEPERAVLDQLVTDGWADLGRRHAGQVAGPYSWWSWRGKAFDNDTGWRIDYVWATQGLAASMQSCVVDRAPSYAQRWSDHAPITATFARSVGVTHAPSPDQR